MPLDKQLRMMRVILHLYDAALRVVSAGVPIGRVLETGLFDRVVRIKYDIKNDEAEALDTYPAEIDRVLGAIVEKGGAAQ